MRALGREEEHGLADDQAVIPSQVPSERRIEPLSDEWFEDLDKSIDEITRLFEEMRMAPPGPEDLDYVYHAEDGLAAIEHDLTNCFTSLEALKRYLGGSRCRRWSTSSGSSDNDLFKLFRPRSMDLGTPHRIRKTKNRVGHRKLMPSISSPISEAVVKQLFGWQRPDETGRVLGIYHSHGDVALVKRTEASGQLIH